MVASIMITGNNNCDPLYENKPYARGVKAGFPREGHNW